MIIWTAKVFAGQKGTKMDPDPKDVEGYNTFIERFKKTLPIMKAATETDEIEPEIFYINTVGG